nr:hypothetical protein Iba_chr01bCG15450 [Ipomoea batatas]
MTSEAQELYANQTPSSDAQSESDTLINEEEPINEAPAIEERVVGECWVAGTIVDVESGGLVLHLLQV